MTKTGSGGRDLRRGGLRARYPGDQRRILEKAGKRWETFPREGWGSAAVGLDLKDVS